MRILPILVAAALAVPALAAADRTIRTLHEDRAATGVDMVRVNFPVGRLNVEPSTDGRVHFDVAVRCRNDRRRCEERAQDVDLDASLAGGTLRLKLEPHSDWTHDLKMEGVLRMPPDLPLRLEMGVGELTLHGLRDDVDVNLGVGEARLHLREADVRSVQVASGVGEANLTVGRRRMEGSGFLGHKVRWGEGTGRARVDLDLGVGESEVVLE